MIRVGRSRYRSDVSVSRKAGLNYRWFLLSCQFHFQFTRKRNVDVRILWMSAVPETVENDSGIIYPRKPPAVTSGDVGPPDLPVVAAGALNQAEPSRISFR